MFDNYLLFAVPHGDIGAVKKTIESIFDINMELIDCSAWGKYYGTPQEPHIDVVSLYRNWDDEEDDFMETKYSEFPLLVSVYDTHNQDDYQNKILGNEDLKAVLVERIEHFDDDS